MSDLAEILVQASVVFALLAFVGALIEHRRWGNVTFIPWACIAVAVAFGILGCIVK